MEPHIPGRALHESRSLLRFTSGGRPAPLLGACSRCALGALLTVYQQIPLRLFDVPLSETLEISDQCGIYAYDAYFLATAQSLRCELLTRDRGLIRAAAQVGVPVREVNP
jgi:hypothetical protein